MTTPTPNEAPSRLRMSHVIVLAVWIAKRFNSFVPMLDMSHGSKNVLPGLLGVAF